MVVKLYHGHMLQGLLVICWERTKVNNCQQMTAGMRHDNLDRLKLYCVEWFVQISSEGAAEHKEEGNKKEMIPEDVVPFLVVDRVHATDAVRFVAVLATNDDNEPAL